MSKNFKNDAEMMQALLDGKRIENGDNTSGLCYMRIVDGWCVDQNNGLCKIPIAGPSWRVYQPPKRKVTKWALVYKDKKMWLGSGLFDTKDEALDRVMGDKAHLDTIQVTFEVESEE